MNNEEWAEVMEDLDTPEIRAARDEFEASQLTPDRVRAMAEALVDENGVSELVRLIALRQGKAGRELFRCLREGLKTDDLRDVADIAWGQQRPGESNSQGNALAT